MRIECGTCKRPCASNEQAQSANTSHASILGRGHGLTCPLAKKDNDSSVCNGPSSVARAPGYSLKEAGSRVSISGGEAEPSSETPASAVRQIPRQNPYTSVSQGEHQSDTQLQAQARKPKIQKQQTRWGGENCVEEKRFCSRNHKSANQRLQMRKWEETIS